jgi:hypothetical protein
MRVWKALPLLLIVLAINSCNKSKEDEENFASADSTPAPAAAPAPAPATAPAAPTRTAPKTAVAPATPRADATATPVDRRERITVPAGTEIEIILADSLNSGKNKPGDEFEANLGAPLSVNGLTVFDRGSKVHGKVADVEGSGRVKGLANMRLTLLTIDATPVTTKSYFVEAESSKGRDAAVVGGAAGIGAAIGAITGGKSGAAKGGAIGGAAGAGTVLATKGKEVDFPPESKLTFVLADDLRVTR